MRRKSMVRTRRFIIVGSGGGEWQTPPVRVQPRRGHLCADDGWPGRSARREKDSDDRCEQANAMRSSEPAQVSEGPSHRVQPRREKKGRGRLIGRTKGGMNR